MFVITTKLEKYFHFRLANKLHNQSKLNPKFYPRMALLDNSTRQKWSIVFVAPGAIEIVVGNISERARKFFLLKLFHNKRKKNREREREVVEKLKKLIWKYSAAAIYIEATEAAAV